ncbi:hypothetical protein [Rhodoferax antarcticus]|uniref:Putative transporter protein n=1 Tax=Rhodoferax antarcticus ANT.BR TaxID=1111071 RepID=A0A1Q8YKN4_9BURK|nr:hypothetical protein [Rhodoferax antarcticus]OLP08523.1 putative transporter protein [Rhodoferax antarcticus ANT.BR]
MIEPALTVKKKIKPFWSPVWAGIALGLVLLLTFFTHGSRAWRYWRQHPRDGVAGYAGGA